jgi:hypothetical protein
MPTPQQPPDDSFEALVKKGFGAFAASVPRTYKENLEYRKKLRVACQNDEEKRRKVWRACKADPLFFFNAFCWVYEPRPMIVNGTELPKVLPFIAWEHQEPMMAEIHAHLGTDDISVEKSRGEGASWTLVLFAVWDWTFNDLTTIGLVSKDENAVDNPDDPDSLFWKLDWELTKLPVWMVGEKGTDYKRDRARHVLKNHRNGSTITGYAATANVASGGRKKWFGMDELAKFPRGPDADAMASTQHVTKCRLAVSTPKGADGAYYKMNHEPSNVVRIRIHWSQNPTRNRGLYRLVNGKPVEEDPKNPLPEDYRLMTPAVCEMFDRLRQKGYKLEGTLRSPWYDRECDRAGATPQNIAQELDIDYGGSAFRIFGADCLAKVEKTVTEPAIRGDIHFTKERITDVTFDLIDNGPFQVWMPLDSFRNPPRGMFLVGADVCSGLGGDFTSNSTLEVIEVATGDQVLEYASNTIAPADFADLAIAVCKWLHGAFLSWEHNGPGSAFTKQIIDRRYDKVYYRTSQSSRKRDRGTKKIGWWTSAETKEVMFEAMRLAINSGTITIRSKKLLAELGQYIRKDQKIFNALTVNAADDSKGATHGDRVIGLGVAVIARKEMPSQTAFTEGQEESGGPPPIDTLAYREWLIEQEKRKREGNAGWDSRTLYSHASR